MTSVQRSNGSPPLSIADWLHVMTSALDWIRTESVSYVLCRCKFETVCVLDIYKKYKLFIISIVSPTRISNFIFLFVYLDYDRSDYYPALIKWEFVPYFGNIMNLIFYTEVAIVQYHNRQHHDNSNEGTSTQSTPMFVGLASCFFFISRKISNIRRTKSHNLIDSGIVLQLHLPIHWSHGLSREWRCSWSSADRRCSNYTWVINRFIAYLY